MSWEQLKEIIDANREQVLKEGMEPITECPRCGYSKLKENASGRKACEMCGWMQS